MQFDMVPTNKKKWLDYSYASLTKSSFSKGFAIGFKEKSKNSLRKNDGVYISSIGIQMQNIEILHLLHIAQPYHLPFPKYFQYV